MENSRESFLIQLSLIHGESFKLVSCSKSVRILLANLNNGDYDQHQVFFHFNKEMSFQLMDEKTIYFESVEELKSSDSEKTTFLVEAETEEPYLFKLANTKKIILKQMNTEKETFFELNDYHRFYLISDTYIGLHFSKPHLAIIGSDEKKFETNVVLIWSVRECPFDRKKKYKLPLLKPIQPYNIRYHSQLRKLNDISLLIKLDSTHGASFKLVSSKKHMLIQLANDENQQVYYHFNDKMDKEIFLKLTEEKPIYFRSVRAEYTDLSDLERKRFLVEIESDEPALFKLANTKTIILKLANSKQEETFFELNDSHHFYLKSDRSIALQLDMSHMRLLPSDEPNFKTDLKILWSEVKSIFDKSNKKYELPLLKSIEPYGIPFHFKLKNPKEVFFKLEFSQYVFIELANERIFYRIGNLDKVNFKLATEKPIYFQYLLNRNHYGNVFATIVDNFFMVPFKLALCNSLQIVRPKKEITFELNDSHRFFFRSFFPVCFYLSDRPF